MRQLGATMFLLIGLTTYCVLHITGGLSLSYVKCFYLLPCFLFFLNMLYDCRNGDMACFIGCSCLAIFFLVMLLTNLAVVKNPYYTLWIFLGLNFVMLLIRLNNE